MYTRETAEKLFFEAAVGRAKEGGFHLGNGAAMQLGHYAQQASSTLFELQIDDVERTSKINRGVEAFRVMVDTMIRMRPQAYSDLPDEMQSNLIGERTLDLAKLELCPGFWPFC